jgi:hypothetical protein
MAVIINASTSTGLVQSADTSGIIEFQSNGSTKATLNSSGFSYPNAVLQVVQAVKTNTFSTTSATFGNVTDLTVSITPASASNRILIAGVLQTSSNANDMYKIRIAKNGTAIFVGDTVAGATSGLSQFYLYTSGSLGNWSTLPVPVYYLDSPATTSAVTYSWQVRVQGSGSTLWINRTSDQSGNTDQNFYGASSIIVMEIAA